MLFLGVKPKVSHKWFRKTICSVDITLANFYLFSSHYLYMMLKKENYYMFQKLIQTITGTVRFSAATARTFELPTAIRSCFCAINLPV